MAKPKRFVTCKVCGCWKLHKALGLCRPCYDKKTYKDSLHKPNTRQWTRATIRLHKKRGFNVQIDPIDLNKKAKNTPNCEYCSSLLDYSYGKGLVYNSPTLDRIDNENVLNMKNTAIICRFCNTSKQNLTLEEWKDYMEYILKEIRY